MKVKIRKGDTVEVISGRFEDKGKRGEVIKVLPQEQRAGSAEYQHAQETPTRGPDPRAHHDTWNY